MAVADRNGLPVAIHVASASPHEVTLVPDTVEGRFVADTPERLIGGKAYQALSGLPFGLACAVVFTLAQNKFNALRARGRSWAILLATWMGVKFVFVGIMLALS